MSIYLAAVLESLKWWYRRNNTSIIREAATHSNMVVQPNISYDNINIQ